MAIPAFGLIWLGAVLGASFAFAAQLVIGRYFGPSGLGEYLAAQALANSLLPVALFGYGALFREQTDGVADALLVSARYVVRITTVLSALLCATISFNFGWAPSRLVVALAFLLNSLAFELLILRFQRRGEFSRVAIIQPIVYLIRLALILVATVFSESLNALFVIVAVGLLTTATWLSVDGRNSSKTGEAKTSTSEIWRCVRRMLPLFSLGMISVAQITVDRLIVGERLGAASLGIYGTVLSLVMLAELLPSSYANRYLLGTLSEDRYLRVTRVSLGILSVGSVLALALAHLGVGLLPSLFGKAFQVSPSLMLWAGVFLVARFATILLLPWALYFGLIRQKVFLDIVVLLLSIVFSYLGATYSDLAAIVCAKALVESMASACVFVFVSRRRYMSKYAMVRSNGA